LDKAKLIKELMRDQLDDVSDKNFNEVMELLEEYKKERDKKKAEKPDLTKVFSKECSLKVHIKGDEKNEHSEASVELDGVNSFHDIMLIGVATIAGILDNIPDEMDKIRVLAEMGTLAIAGKHAGLYKTKEEMLKAEEEEE